MSFKKIDKFFALSDSKVNVYGFRLLTDGFLMDEFAPNPIGYYMHGDTSEHPREQGVLVRWEELKVEGDTIMGKPCINLSHPRGAKTVDEVENGFLNGASVGKIVLVDSREDLIDGVVVLTGTKWYCKEISLVDMPGNRGMLAELYDLDGGLINLSDYAIKNQQNAMKKITLTITPALVALLSLSDSAEEKDLTSAIQNLADTAAKVPALEQKATELQTEVTSLKGAAVTKEVTDLLDKALNTEKKITVALKTQLAADYAEKPLELKNLLDAMPAAVDLSKVLPSTLSDKTKDLADKTWSELDKSGKLQDLKDADIDLFKKKYKEQFGTEYAG